MKNYLLISIFVFSALVGGCQGIYEPIIEEAVEKAVDEYNNSNPLAERVIEVEKIVEVPVEKIVEVPVEKIVEVPVEKIVEITPDPTPTPEIEAVKLPSDIEKKWICDANSEACKINSGASVGEFNASRAKNYDIGLSFVSGYKASELKIDVDLCYPRANPCWQENGEDGYATLTAQPVLNDYIHAEFKWIPAIATQGWEGTIIYTSKVSIKTPTEWYFYTYDPIVTITDPDGNQSTYQFKNWRAVTNADLFAAQ